MFSWYKYLIVNLFFPTSVFGIGIFFLIVPVPDLCRLHVSSCFANAAKLQQSLLVLQMHFYSAASSCFASTWAEIYNNLFLLCNCIKYTAVSSCFANASKLQQSLLVLQMQFYSAASSCFARRYTTTSSCFATALKIL